MLGQLRYRRGVKCQFLQPTEQQAHKVERPQIVIAQSSQEELRGESLAIVHGRLGMIIADHSINNDLCVLVIEETLGMDLASCLTRPGFHEPEGGDADADATGGTACQLGKRTSSDGRRYHVPYEPLNQELGSSEAQIIS